MATGPFSSVVATSIAVLGLLGGTGGPLIWSRLHTTHVDDHPATTPAVKESVVETIADSKPVDEPVTFDSSILTEAMKSLEQGRQRLAQELARYVPAVFSKDMQDLEQSDKFNIFGLGPLRKDRLYNLLQEWGMADFTDQVWSALDAWTLGPLGRAKVSAAMESYGITNRVDTANIAALPGLFMLAFGADVILIVAFLLWRLVKRCCSSRKPEIGNAEETEKREKQQVREGISRLPTPARGKKPSVSAPCPQAARSDAEQTRISQPCEPVACPNLQDDHSTDDEQQEVAEVLENADAAHRMRVPTQANENLYNLPPGWQVQVSRSSGRTYYWNAELNLSQFQHPLLREAETEGLPPGWFKVRSRSTGRPYYYNQKLQINTFHHPSGLAQEQLMSTSGEGAASQEDDASDDVFDSEAMEQASCDTPDSSSNDEHAIYQ